MTSAFDKLCALGVHFNLGEGGQMYLNDELKKLADNHTVTYFGVADLSLVENSVIDQAGTGRFFQETARRKAAFTATTCG